MSAHLKTPDQIEKEDRCVKVSQNTLYAWAGGLGAGCLGGWTAGAQFSPYVAKMNWRAKGAISTAIIVILSYYKAERALIDCNQEYEERSRARKSKAKADLREAQAAQDAAAAKQKQ